MKLALRTSNQLLWALIYLCLRCGDYEAAHDKARGANKEDIAGYLDELINNLVNPTSMNFSYRHVSLQ